MTLLLFILLVVVLSSIAAPLAKGYGERLSRGSPDNRDLQRLAAELERTEQRLVEAERRLLLDTYRTFGCESGQPTFRYSLLDGVKDGYLINPTVVDARTEITTALLSEEGFIVSFTDDTGEDQQEAFKQREFEKRFIARVLVKADGNLCKAADLLGMHRNTLSRKIDEYKIKKP